MGAPTDGTEGIESQAYVFYGGKTYSVAADADIRIEISPTPENRIELANIGDVNDDGRSDVLLGGTGLQAHAYLFWGGLALRDDLSIADADLLFMPEDLKIRRTRSPPLETSTTMRFQISSWRTLQRQQWSKCR